jgi:hypothetical protein
MIRDVTEVQPTPPAGAPELCVVHLVRAANGIAPFRRFIESYIRYRAGVQHEFVLLFKGFGSEREAAPYRELVDGLGAEVMFVADDGFDLNAYAQAARQLEHCRLCFVNSHTRVLSGDWLAPLTRWVSEPGVGLVGATGTFESHLQGAARGGESTQSLLWLRRRVAVRKLRAHFPPFPNPHLRSNAFLADRELVLELGLERAVDKDAAHGLESGWHSITRQVLAMGLRVLVVGRDENAYEPEEWPTSRTFRSGEQENLLIGDNRTEEYRLANPAERSTLNELAWGRSPPLGPSVDSL